MKPALVRLIALIVLLVGAAALVYGIVSYTEFRNSPAGKVTDAARGLARNLVGEGNVGMSDTERRAVIFMVGGGIGVLVGGGLLVSGRRR